MAITKHNGKSVDNEFTGNDLRDLKKASDSISPGFSTAPSGPIPHPEPSKKPEKMEESK